MDSIKINDRFGRLTNLDISTHYQHREYWLMKSDFMGAFAYWVVSQSPYDAPDITNALTSFGEYLDAEFPSLKNLPAMFTYDELNSLLTEDFMESIPAIEALNHAKIDNGQGIIFTSRYDQPKPDYDFIDLGALARNVRYMILREHITQSE